MPTKKIKIIFYLILFLFVGINSASAQSLINGLPYILSNDTASANSTPQPSQVTGLSATGTPPILSYKQPEPVATPVASSLEGAELHINSFYDISPTNNINGGTSYGIDTTLYSPTINGNWRIFAGESFSHEIEPVGEGDIAYSRTVSGVEYHTQQTTTTLAPTYNNFNGQERIGAVGDMSWNVNDDWNVGGGGQYFSRDIPLRALNAGITANSYNVNATWTPNDQRNIRVDGDAMSFSDYNIRTSTSGAYTERVFANSHFRFDGLVTLAESENSKDNNPLYFSPSQDGQGMAGLRVTQPLYQESSLTYQHSLEVKPGVYWQESYGCSPAVTLHYEQRVEVDHNLDVGAGVLFSRQSYNGTPQNDEMLLLDVAKYF